MFTQGQDILCVPDTCARVSSTVNECVACKVSGLGWIEAAERAMNNGNRRS